MPLRHIREELLVIRTHLERESVSADFIVLHAQALLDHARFYASTVAAERTGGDTCRTALARSAPRAGVE